MSILEHYWAYVSCCLPRKHPTPLCKVRLVYMNELNSQRINIHFYFLPVSISRICPIFQVSNVTGKNLDLLRSFLNLLSARMHTNEDKPAEFQIDETYSVPVSPLPPLTPCSLPPLFFYLFNSSVM